jgi:hypothetical protein
LSEFSESATGTQIDIKQTATYRGLKAAVIILGILILLALATLVVGFVFKLGSRSAHRGEATAFVPPPGASIVAMEVSGDRLVLHLHTASGDEVDIVDTESGKLVSRLKFAAPAP